MSHTDDPTKPVPDAEKFKPSNVAEGKPSGSARHERDMKDLPRGSEEDIRRKSGNRNG